MRKLAGAGTRRQLFSSIAAAAASIPLVVLHGRSAGAMGSNPGKGHGDGGGGGDTGCCCLLKGTKVSTPAGERAVEDLQIGDEVLTLSGAKAVKWIGYRKFAKDNDRPWPDSVMPIRIVPSAIDDAAPHSDLYLSPQHCVFVNGMLIPVTHLVNGSSIAPAVPFGATAIEYYHIEFETHEVVFAEGARVESFIEEDSRREHFSNFVQYERLYGRDRQPRKTPFAPIVRYRSRRQKIAGLARSFVSGAIDVRDPIQVARDQLARRAETALT